MASGLTDAVLDRAVLYGVQFRHASLQGASLRYANLKGANLSHAVASCASFYGADLEETLFFMTSFKDTDFTEARLFRTAFTACPTLTRSTGLDAINHAAPSFIDIATMRACLKDLPPSFLSGMNLRPEEAEGLAILLQAK